MTADRSEAAVRLDGMRWRWLVIALLLASPTSGRASDFWDEVRSPGLHAHAALLQEAAHALHSNDARRALELTAAVAPRFADRADTLRLRGLALGATGDTELALATLRRALVLDPTALDDTPSGVAAALLAAKVSDFAFASSVLTRVVGNMPALPIRRQLFALLGDTLLTQGPPQLDAAVVAYREALRAEGATDARSLLGLALALRRHAEPAAAAEVAARLTAGSRTDVVVAALPLPATEKSARLAIGAEAAGDLAAARSHWIAAAGGPWGEHATGELARLDRLARTKPGARRR